ncbi:MAG: hypothetical protein ACTFAL_03145 [Candidatus Electronema sp. V4]|uniref:hypothetical protein n=1 Tax=Candidatus Electronema sp. V4 TaxID=3454756 RepID=UPI004055817B
MSIIDQLRAEIDTYETDKCSTTIINFAIPGTALNVGEAFTFQVKVENNGELDMKNVKVQVIGTSYADVAYLVPQFSSSAVSGTFNLDANQEYIVFPFLGRAKKDTGNASLDIVTARIHSWNASFDHILDDHSGAGIAEGKLNKKIEKD